MTTQAVQQEKTSFNAPPLLLDRAFFGKTSCLSLQIRGNTIYMKWGKKDGDKWVWKNVKFNDIEAGLIIRVLEGADEKQSFYHSFENDSTKIWFTRNNENVTCTAEDFSKPLSPGEQVVLAQLLRNSIWMVNLAST